MTKKRTSQKGAHEHTSAQNPQKNMKPSETQKPSETFNKSQQTIVEKIILIAATFNPESHEVLAPIHFATREDPAMQDVILKDISRRVLERIEGHEIDDDLSVVFLGGFDLDGCAEKIYKALGFERLTLVLEQMRKEKPDMSFEKLIFGFNS